MATIQNAVRVKSVNKIYKSWHVHDYVEFETRYGPASIDGGNEYIRTNISPDNDDIEWLALDDEDSYDDIIDRYVVDFNGHNQLAKELDNIQLDTVIAKIPHPKAKEALTMLKAKRVSLLDSALD
ncbi:MAG: hypothetical protein JSS66_07050 [Armatimonadetes bacterium]|nr:hypothetical protein [Armatimonadota bacterium]